MKKYQSKYYKKNKEARLNYGRKYYSEHKEEIRIYQNNYHKEYYKRRQMRKYIIKEREEKNIIYIKYQDNKKRKLLRKYWNIWYDKVFGYRERERLREILTVRFD